MDNNNIETTFKRIIAYMTANGVDEWERSGSVPEFLVIYRYLLSKISPHGENCNEHELTKNEKQRLHNTVRANFSVYQQMPNFPKIFPYAVVLRWANSL